MPVRLNQLSNTYSIVARDPETCQLGAAVQSHYMGVHIVTWLEPGIGAVVTQSLVNISYGPLALAMLREDVPPDRIIAALTASDDNPHVRQAAVINTAGIAAAWTGDNCIREAGHQTGKNYSVQANMMTLPTVVPAMAAAFENTTGDLAQRMMAALQAAEAQGGDIRGMQSAALKVVPGNREKPCWAADYDLRVDEHDEPLAELARLVRLTHAHKFDEKGHVALALGNHTAAREQWAQARAEAPELEELPYWHAISMADEMNDFAGAIKLLQDTIAPDERREHWRDLIGRLGECGMIEHEETVTRLMAALE